MSKIFIPSKGPEDWKDFLAEPSHWRTGYSAKALAYCREEAQGFPERGIRDSPNPFETDHPALKRISRL